MTDGLTDSQQPHVPQADSQQVEVAEDVQVHDGDQTPEGGNLDNPAFESSKQTLNEAAGSAETAATATEIKPDAAATLDNTSDESPEGATAAAAGEKGEDVSEGSDEDDSEQNDSDEDEEDEEEGDPLDIEGEVAADYLEELLDIADLDGDIDTYVDGGRAHVSVLSENNTLVGAKGEVLDALQELARLAVMTETGNRSRLMLDVAGYRERRRKELRELAGEAVEEAKSSAESVRLNPMNPFERKIVHDAVAAAGLSSESEGEEPKRRVVVIPTA